MRGLGINGYIVDWAKEFLIGRKPVVVVEGAVSEESAVLRGVSQGSVFRPL